MRGTKYLGSELMKLAEGDIVQLIDSKGRRYQIKLKAGATFFFHRGAVEHDRLIGQEPGSWVKSSLGESLLVLKPTLADFILKAKRGAQVIYPKDIGAILMLADIFPGARVLEAGTGSGALTLALLRAAGERGRVISYEVRKEFLEVARRNIEEFFSSLPPNLVLREKDIYRGLEEEDRELDRLVLDLPEPWRVVEQVKEALRPGGIFVAYNPTILQIFKLARRVEKAGGFYQVGVYEVLMRSWRTERRVLRPELRMVAHTGFVYVARRVKELTTA